METSDRTDKTHQITKNMLQQANSLRLMTALMEESGPWLESKKNTRTQCLFPLTQRLKASFPDCFPVTRLEIHFTVTQHTHHTQTFTDTDFYQTHTHNEQIHAEEPRHVPLMYYVIKQRLVNRGWLSL